MTNQTYENKMYPTITTMEEEINRRIIEVTTFNTEIQVIKDIENYFENEIKIYEDKYKKCKRFSYIVLVSEALSSLALSVAGIAIGTSLSVTGVGVLAGVPIVGGSLALGTFILNLSNHIYNKKRRKYLRTISLAKITKIEYEQLHKEAMLDKKIDEKEYKKLTDKYNYYKDHKKEIEENCEIKKEDIFLHKDTLPENLQNQLEELLLKLKLKSV